MIYEKIKLNSNNSTLTLYIPSTYDSFSKDKKWPMVVICPGGGYEHLSDREAEPVALKLNSLGFAACTLKYTLAPMQGGEAIDDLKEAIKTLRQNAKKYHIADDKIIACGFSAGGHLAASVACYNDEKLSHPNYLLLCYPVITSNPKFCHEGSIKNILGSSSKYDREYFSLEKHITKDFPPTFMWHTNEDTAVPCENTLLFAEALRKNKIDFEYHLFAKGSHGLALATKETSNPDGSNIQQECAIWIDLFANWAKSHGII